MPEINTGLRKPAYICRETGEGMWLAVFDGMGGESLGEAAAFAAASEMRRQCETLPRPFMSETRYIANMCMALNAAVVNTAKQQSIRRHMGTTLAALYIARRRVYVCNVGDSRVYRLRGKELSQLSQDHVDGRPYPPGVKPPLMQHLGLDPSELLIRPHIAKERLAEGDCYLLCSDGLTDMLTELQIADMMRIPDAAACAEALVSAALDHGGRDNVTVIVCRIGGRNDLPHSSGHETQYVVK